MPLQGLGCNRTLTRENVWQMGLDEDEVQLDRIQQPGFTFGASYKLVATEETPM